MKRFIICLFVCCIGMTVFAGPRDRKNGRRPNPPRHAHRHNHHHRNDGLRIANGILGIVDKGLRILAGPQPTVVVQQPQVVVPQPPVVVQQPAVVVQPPATQVIQVGGTNYVIYTDANGQRRAVPINQ